MRRRRLRPPTVTRIEGGGTAEQRAPPGGICPAGRTPASIERVLPTGICACGVRPRGIKSGLEHERCSVHVADAFVERE
jgi:hypothetical protein